MSKRLQVLLDEAELRELQRVARARRMTVAAWVREVLRTAGRREPLGDPSAKLKAVRHAARQAFPTADMGQMNAEIASGYSSGDGS